MRCSCYHAAIMPGTPAATASSPARGPRPSRPHTGPHSVGIRAARPPRDRPRAHPRGDWSANPLAVKIGLGDAPPVPLAWMRFSSAGSQSCLCVVDAAPGVFDVPPGEWRVLWSLGLLFAVQIGAS